HAQLPPCTSTTPPAARLVVNHPVPGPAPLTKLVPLSATTPAPVTAFAPALPVLNGAHEPAAFAPAEVALPVAFITCVDPDATERELVLYPARFERLSMPPLTVVVPA